MKKDFQVTEKGKKQLAIAGIAIAAAIILILSWYIGKPLVSFVKNSDIFRLWVQEQGFFAKMGFVGMMMAQVVLAVIPGEPLEIAAGFAFGAWEGTLLCLLGSVLGSMIIFLTVKKIGAKIIEIFFKKEDLEKIAFLKNTQKLKSLLFIVFLIPGTPKDMLSYFVGLTRIDLLSWLCISTVARIPSVITSTIGGSALGDKNYMMAAAVFAVTAILSIMGLLIYNKICNRHKEEIDK